MKAKRVSLVLATIMFFSLLSFKAYSLGISTNRIVDFEANSVTHYPFCVRNSLNEEDPFEIRVEGDIAEYITLSQTSDVLGPKEIKCYEYTVTLPEKVSPPGSRSAYVVATEIPKRIVGGGLNFNLIVSTKHQLTIRIPYPGKYLETQFLTHDVRVGDTVYFVITVTSRGTDLIGKIKAKIDIFQGEEKIDSVETTAVENLETSKSKELAAMWNTAGRSSGRYKAVATITYDEKNIEEVAYFRVGSLEMNILNFTKEVFSGKINKYQVEIESNWNEKVDGVYARVKATNQRLGNHEFKTLSYDVLPWERKILDGYWDTAEIAPGTYNAEVTLYYSDEVSVASGLISVLEKPPEEVREVMVEAPKPMINNTVLLIAVVALVVINMIWMISRRKKR